MNSLIEELAREVDASAAREILSVYPRILALGEPTHGRDDLLDLRNDLFRDLILRGDGGFRAIALESDIVRGVRVDEYIQSGIGSLDEAMALGFSHGFGASEANRELVRWMRVHNDSRPAAEHIRFAGFDPPVEMESAASPGPSLHALHAVLTSIARERLPCDSRTIDALVGDESRWIEPAAMMDPARSIGRSEDALQLRVLADDMAALLGAVAPAVAAVSREALRRARVHARCAVGLLRYHHAMADRSPHRMAGMLGQRATMMADNLLALAEDGPVLAFAHNAHLQRPESSMRMGGQPLHWWSAGAILDARIGGEYRYVATALGTMEDRDVFAPPAQTLEGMMYDGTRRVRCLFDARELARATGAAVARTSPWFGYAPLDPNHLYDVDAVAYLRDVER